MRSLRYYLDLLGVLAHKDIKLKYKNTALGYLWSLLNPLAFTLVFYIAFKTVLKIPIENYVLFLLSGLFPWQWLSNCLNSAPFVFLANSTLIKKVAFPRALLVVSQIMQEMMHFVLTLPIIVMLVFAFGKTPSLSWLPGIPLLLLIQAAVIYGLALTVATLNLFFRDLERIVNIGVSMIFYMTPILYSESMVPSEYAALVDLNPFAPIMVGWRNLFLDGVLDHRALLIGAVFGCASVLLGQVVYTRLSWKFAEVT
jgi:lipopolysaccharide transport system permease protein